LYLVLIYTRISWVFGTDFYAYVMCICYWFICAYRVCTIDLYVYLMFIWCWYTCAFHVYLLRIYMRIFPLFATDLHAHIVCYCYWFDCAYRMYLLVINKKLNLKFYKTFFHCKQTALIKQRSIKIEERRNKIKWITVTMTGLEPWHSRSVRSLYRLKTEKEKRKRKSLVSLQCYAFTYLAYLLPPSV